MPDDSPEMRVPGFQALFYKPEGEEVVLTNPGMKMVIPLCAAQSLTIRAGKQSVNAASCSAENNFGPNGSAGNYFLVSSSLTIASTSGFKISRVTACKTSGFILAKTFATISSILGAAAAAGSLTSTVPEYVDSSGAGCCSATTCAVSS